MRIRWPVCIALSAIAAHSAATPRPHFGHAHKAKTHASPDSTRDTFHLRRELSPRITPLTADEVRLGRAVVAEATSAKYWARPFCWIASKKHIEGCDGIADDEVDEFLNIDRSGAVEDIRVRLASDGEDAQTWALAVPRDPTTRHGLFCAGYSLQVLLQVMKREDLFREMTARDLRVLRRIWFGWDRDMLVRNKLYGRSDIARRQSELALTALGLGRAVERLHDGRPDARPGDFLVFRFDSGRFHTALFDRWVTYRGNPIGVGFIGANLEGVGRKFYCFKNDETVAQMPRALEAQWCADKPRVRRETLFASRLSPTLATKPRPTGSR